MFEKKKYTHKQNIKFQLTNSGILDSFLKLSGTNMTSNLGLGVNMAKKRKKKKKDTK
jgi:hypothetical protein